jgi:hypothetical protein
MSIRLFRRPAPRHSAHGTPHREMTPREAAAFADGLHGRPDTERDGLDVAEALQAYAPEPVVMTAGSAPWAGGQDPAMETGRFDPHAAEPWTRPEDMQAARTRRYVPPAPPAADGVLVIPLDRDILLMIRAAIARGRYEDVEAYADQAARRAAQRFDWAQARLRHHLDAGWRACMAMAASRRAA